MGRFTITISGIDDTTSLDSLVDLTKRFPFVEWGILYSTKNTGRQPRYPSEPMIRLFSSCLPTSLHLCGDISRVVRENRVFVSSVLKPLSFIIGSNNVSPFARIQLNGWQPHDEVPSLNPERIVLQVRGRDMFDETLARLRTLGRFVYPQILFDPSGGRGVRTDFEWPSKDEIFQFNQFVSRVGFAGGINPNNVREVIETFLERTNEPFWLDMESGVRRTERVQVAASDGMGITTLTRDLGLDLDAVEKVLSIAAEYQTKVVVR